MPRPTNQQRHEAEALHKGGLRFCHVCVKTLPVSEFGVLARNPQGLQPTCKLCTNTRNQTYAAATKAKDPEEFLARKRESLRKWKDANPEKVRAGNRRTNLRRHYGLTVEQWDTLLVAQAGRCPICSAELVDPHTDHNHTTGAVRAILCNTCNVGIGAFYENPTTLRSAATYIEEHA